MHPVMWPLPGRGFGGVPVHYPAPSTNGSALLRSKLAPGGGAALCQPVSRTHGRLVQCAAGRSGTRHLLAMRRIHVVTLQCEIDARILPSPCLGSITYLPTYRRYLPSVTSWLPVLAVPQLMSDTTYCPRIESECRLKRSEHFPLVQSIYSSQAS